MRCGSLRLDADNVSFRSTLQSAPSVTELLAEYDPDLTIVQLGANQIHTAFRDPQSAGRQVRSLAALVQAQHSGCLWVGPPYGSERAKPHHKMAHLYDVLHSAVPAGCNFLDASPQALPFLDYARITERAGRSGDGRHFDSIGIHGKTAARRWALAVFHRVRELLDADPRTQPRQALASLSAVAR